MLMFTYLLKLGTMVTILLNLYCCYQAKNISQFSLHAGIVSIMLISNANGVCILDLINIAEKREENEK